MRIDETVNKYLTEEKAYLQAMTTSQYAGKVVIRKGDKVYDPLMKKWINFSALVHMSDWQGLPLEKGAAQKLLQGIK